MYFFFFIILFSTLVDPIGPAERLVYQDNKGFDRNEQAYVHYDANQRRQQEK